MQRPVTVLMDADGCVLDFHTRALTTIAPIVGKLYTAADFPTWDIFETISREYEKACYKAFRKKGFCAGIEPYPGAIGFVQRLREITKEIHVVTSPIHGPYWYYERVEAMKNHFGFSTRYVHHISAKHIANGDVLIEDKPKNLEEWWQAYPNSRPFLVDQPYNRHATHLDSVRVTSWQPILDHVQHLVEQRRS